MIDVSLIPPLEALRSVRHIMLSEFPDVDVIKLHRYIDHGVTRTLARTASTDYRYDPTTKKLVIEKPSLEHADVRASEEVAQRAFERTIEPQMKRFAALMEAVAPALMRFSQALDAVRRYISTELRQNKTMLGYGVVIFVVMILILLYAMMSIVHDIRVTLNEGGKVGELTKSQWIVYPLVDRIGRAVLIFVLPNLVVWTWINTMKERIKQLEHLKKALTSYERYEKMLAKNLYVRYAFAYTKGDQDRFVREQMVEQMQEAEAEAEELESVCGGDATAARKFERNKCKLEGCDFVNKSLDETLTGYIEHAWAGRSDLDACGALMLSLLEYLAKLQDGSIFDEHDRHSMWQRIHKRVNLLERFSYRRLDVDKRSNESLRSEISVVRDRVLPLLRLTVVETRELEPDGEVEFYADSSFTGKLQVWKACLDTPSCVWAAYHPRRGGLLACTGLEHGEAAPDGESIEGQRLPRPSIFDTVAARDQTNQDAQQDGPGVGGKAVSPIVRQLPPRNGKVRHESTPLVVPTKDRVPEGQTDYGIGDDRWVVLVKRANLSDVTKDGAPGAPPGSGFDGNSEQPSDVKSAEGTSAVGVADDVNNSAIATSVPPTFVCGRGINAEAEGALRSLPDAPASSSPAAPSSGGEPTERDREEDGQRAGLRRLRAMCSADSACGQDCHVLSQNEQGDPQRWTFASDALLDSSYRAVFAEPRRGVSDSVFCMRVPPSTLFKLSLYHRSNALTTLQVLLPELVDRMFDVLRRHPDRVYVSDYTQYLFTEMEAFYGRSLFEKVKPLMTDAVRRLQDRLSALWNAVEDSGKYVTQKRFDFKVEDLGFTRTRKMVYEIGRMNVLLQNHWRNFGTFQTGMSTDGRVGVTAGVSGQNMKQAVVDLFVMVLTLLSMGVASRVRCYKQGECTSTDATRAVMIMLTAALFTLTLVMTNVKRAAARGRFDLVIRERNAKTLVTTTSRLLDMLAQRLEHIAGQRVKAATESFRVIRKDVSDVYTDIEYHSGLRRLYPDVDEEGADAEDSLYAEKLIETESPDLRAMYRHLRTIIERFYACNSLDGYSAKPPFPFYEIINYFIVIVGACALLWFAMKKLRPVQHVHFVGELSELKADIERGHPPPRDFQAVLACNKSDSETIWPILTTVLTGLLLLATIMLAVYMVRYSNMYELGLYASGLFSRSKCVRK